MKENSKENPTPQENINPDDYGYRNEQTIEISPHILFQIMPFLRKVAEQESGAMNIITPSEEAGQMPSKTRHHTLTDLGVEAAGALTMYLDIHMDNIQKGIAVSREVLEKEAASAIPVERVSAEAPVVEE